MMEMNHLYLSWVLSALAIIVGFAALYYANDAKSSVERKLNKFVDTKIAKIEEDVDEVNKKVTDISVRVNEQLHKLRLRDDKLREEVNHTKEKLSDLDAKLKNLDNRILPKYKR